MNMSSVRKEVITSRRASITATVTVNSIVVSAIYLFVQPNPLRLYRTAGGSVAFIWSNTTLPAAFSDGGQIAMVLGALWILAVVATIRGSLRRRRARHAATMVAST